MIVEQVVMPMVRLKEKLKIGVKVWVFMRMKVGQRWGNYGCGIGKSNDVIKEENFAVR